MSSFHISDVQQVKRKPINIPKSWQKSQTILRTRVKLTCSHRPDGRQRCDGECSGASGMQSWRAGSGTARRNDLGMEQELRGAWSPGDPRCWGHRTSRSLEMRGSGRSTEREEARGRGRGEERTWSDHESSFWKAEVIKLLSLSFTLIHAKRKFLKDTADRRAGSEEKLVSICDLRQTSILSDHVPYLLHLTVSYSYIWILHKNYIPWHNKHVYCIGIFCIRNRVF